MMFVDGGWSEIGMERGITFGKLEHGLRIEELGNADILEKTLSSSGLNHKFARQVRNRARLKRSQLNLLV